VDVCVALSRLSLDRPFTYVLPEGLPEAGVGSLVSVPFHGRTLKGWVLGAAESIPEGRLGNVRRVRSGVRFFDGSMLKLLRWTSERYIAPLATVIERSHPPRVASEEGGGPAGEELLAGTAPGTTTWVRPLPGREADECVAAVHTCLSAGRSALVLVPEVEPLPATARVVLQSFGERAVLFAGGQPRQRYRTWLDIKAGRFEVVVGTRPAVFAPLSDLGLVWISREVHPGHREDRSPYYHVRDVAMARASLHGAACVLASLSPSVETAAAAAAGTIRTRRPPRTTERAAAPLVETAPPEAEDRSARLGALLKRGRSAALILSRRGYGVARVCRTCGEPASCALCRGPIVLEEGSARCRVCGSPGRCASCGGGTFGVERGGTERIAEWAARQSAAPVDLEAEGRAPPPPAPDRVLVGTASAVKDVGVVRLDVVAVLDPDRALARPGIHAGEQALATWMEAAAWAGPRSEGGRVLLQTRRPGHPAAQALIRWDPLPYLLGEAGLRAEAGFPPNHPVFRVAGTSPALEAALLAAGAGSVLATGGERGEGGGRAEIGTVCLVAVPPEALPGLRRAILRLAADGVVTRVEAEPQL
jgi:primosomal protein N' (replication factor Y) (superfamily II helicase)